MAAAVDEQVEMQLPLHGVILGSSAYADRVAELLANRSHAISWAASASRSMIGWNPGGITSSPAVNFSGSANNRTFGFKNPLNSPALRMVTRATHASIQHPSSLERPSPSTDSMPDLLTASRAS